MGNIGVPELIVIFVVALLVFGPRKLPEIGKSLGKALKEFQRARNELISTVEEEVRKIESEPTTTTSPITSQAHTEPKLDPYPHDPTGPTG
jgi:sec-independent protein translocase protein TatA